MTVENEKMVRKMFDKVFDRAYYLAVKAVLKHQLATGLGLRNHNSYHLGGLFAKALCKGIGTVVEALGQILHPLLHLFAYLWRAAQGPADCGNAHTQLLGQILQ